MFQGGLRETTSGESGIAKGLSSALFFVCNMANQQVERKSQMRKNKKRKWCECCKKTKPSVKVYGPFMTRMGAIPAMALCKKCAESM